MPVIPLFTLSPLPSGFTLPLTLLSFQRPPLDIVLWRVFRHFVPSANIFWLFIQENLWQNIFPHIHPCIAYLLHVTETWWMVVIKGQKSQSWPGEGKMEVENLKVTVIIESALMRLLRCFKALRATWKLAQWTTKSLSNKCLWTPSTVSYPYTTLWYAWFGWKVNHFNLQPQSNGGEAFSCNNFIYNSQKSSQNTRDNPVCL